MLGNATAFLDHWQAMSAGILGFAAAIIVVALTLLSERRKRKHELRVLRRSLGIEVRQFMANAYRAHNACREMLKGDKTAIHAVMVEDKARLPASAIYPHAAARIAEFGNGGEHIVLFYNKIAVVREAAERLTRHPNLDDLPPDEIAAAATALIQIAETGLLLLPILKTEVKSDIGTDKEALEAITNASRSWPHSGTVLGASSVSTRAP